MFEDEDRFRRHKGACPYYRENWVQGDQMTPQGEVVLYEIYCLKGWPPESQGDQNCCMESATHCWRNGESHKVSPERSRARREGQTAKSA